MATIPGYVTHYYLGDRRPFLNLSDLDRERRDAVMQELIALRHAGRQARPFGARYAKWRQLTESRLRELFILAGGRPERDAPHYFVLGESRWFSGLAEDMRSVKVPLSHLSGETTSFTLLDSFGAMGFGPGFGFPDRALPHQRQVYRLDEMQNVVERFGMPSGNDEEYVEVQVWADVSVSPHLPS